MTDDDLALVLFIATHHAQHGYAPSFRQIAETRGIAMSTVQRRVDLLIAAGFLSKKAHARRTLNLVAAGYGDPQ